MARRTLSAWAVFAGTLACTVGLSGDAEAGWAHGFPTVDRIVANLRGSIITSVQATKNGSPASGVRGTGTQILADVPLSCSDGSTMTYYALRSSSPAGAFVIGENAGTAVTVPVLLETGENLAQSCGTTTAGVKTIRLFVYVLCTKPGQLPGLDIKKATYDIQTIVTCDPDYRSPTESVPVRWRHTCPAGYVLSSTGQQSGETATKSPLCVKPGSAGSGPKG